MDEDTRLVDRVPANPKLLVIASSQERCEIPLPQNQQIPLAAATFIAAVLSSGGRQPHGVDGNLYPQFVAADGHDAAHYPDTSMNEPQQINRPHPTTLRDALQAVGQVLARAMM
uniref:Uncharacterized protein n=1 Tax=Arundo donax TaxID=35708 RepID=A0A0A9G1P9_ARUDO